MLMVGVNVDAHITLLPCPTVNAVIWVSPITQITASRPGGEGYSGYIIYIGGGVPWHTNKGGS